MSKIQYSYILLSFLAFISFQNTSQVLAQGLQNLNPFKKTDIEKPVIAESESKQIINDIYQLSSHNMRGRIMGTTGEQMAITFLTKRFKKIGLGEIDKNYTRRFSYATSTELSDESIINIGKINIRVPQEGFPLAFTDTQNIESYILKDAQEFQGVWILPAFKNQEEARKSPEEIEQMLYKKALNAKERGAIAVVFYNNLADKFICTFQQKSALSGIGIPVFEISKKVYLEQCSRIKKLTPIKLHAVLRQQLKQGYNLYGVINNGAKKTIIISANYDGFLPPGLTPKEAENLPNANFNASGAATLLALAERLIKEKSNYNYIFILYSGSYQGRIGSEKLFTDKNFFTQNLAFAIHFDAVGRLDPQTKNIFVSGVGTYAGFKNFFASNDIKDVNYILEAKGRDSSDFNTYYNHQLPYLRFSTGYNEDMGTPQDMPQKININGIGNMLNKVFYILAETSNHQPNISFIAATDKIEKRTGEVKSMTPPVSLGVIPDLSAKEDGLKINKVNKGSDADKAGIQNGDIIIQIRNFPIKNYDDYVNVISRFKKGEKVYIKIKRRGNVMQKLVTFS